MDGVVILVGEPDDHQPLVAGDSEPRVFILVRLRTVAESMILNKIGELAGRVLPISLARSRPGPARLLDRAVSLGVRKCGVLRFKGADDQTALTIEPVENPHIANMPICLETNSFF